MGIFSRNFAKITPSRKFPTSKYIKQAANAQRSLWKRAVSPEPSLLPNSKERRRHLLRPRFMPLPLLVSCTYMFEECHYAYATQMLEFINYNKTCVKRPLSKRQKWLPRPINVNAAQNYCRLLRIILQYFRPSFSYQLSLRSLFYCIFDTVSDGDLLFNSM